MTDERPTEYQRFNLTFRIQHVILVITFLLLPLPAGHSNTLNLPLSTQAGGYGFGEDLRPRESSTGLRDSS